MMKPCPFCGSGAHVSEYGDCHIRYSVYCDNEKCILNDDFDTLFCSELKARELWNNRAESDELPEWVKENIQHMISGLELEIECLNNIAPQEEWWAIPVKEGIISYLNCVLSLHRD